MSGENLNSDSSDPTPPAEFPVARAEPLPSSWWAGLSRMWGITLACAALAVGLTWYSIDSPGPEIVIHFAEGHGLKPGDALRHRGIDVGRVSSVELDANMSGIDVKVELDSAAAAIADADSRFWIVRPQFDLTGVSGLETAVGSKYIAVNPGNSGTKQKEFDGLATRPPDGLGRNGLEIVLRGDERYGVNPGSPVTWRGIEVGQVIASNLSADALHVDTRIQIMEAHRRLVSRQSKFWVTSGLQMKVGMTGLKVNTETLDEIARGGIAFMTPVTREADDPVQPGDMFTLHAELDEDWLASATPLQLLQQSPPPTASVLATWKQKHFGITRSHGAAVSALTVTRDGGPVMIIPADVIAAPSSAIEGTFQLALLSISGGEQLPLNDVVPLADSTAQLSIVQLDPNQLSAFKSVDRNRFRNAETPEDCLLIRRSWLSGSDGALLVETIGKHELTDKGDHWPTSLTRLSRETWHGATVLSAVDEKIIGMMIIDKDGSAVTKLPASLVN